VRMPLFRGTKRWPLVVAGLFLSSMLLAACGENSPSILNTAGPVAQSESGVFYLILIIATIIFVGVESWLLYSIFRYRERPGMPNPRQIHGSTKVEVLWTVIPAVILFIVLAITISGLFSVAAQPPGQALDVEVIGHQWWWEFYYPEYHFTTADTLHIPVNTIIHADLYSNNVIHSFWVPALTGKTDVIPGHDNTKWFKANKTGTYLGLCAEYCGLQHANMKFQVSVDTPDAFNTWVSQQQQAAVSPPAGSLAAQGEKIFAQQCTSCHGIVGVNLPSPVARGEVDPSVACNDPNNPNAAVCKVGPNLTHFGSRNLIAGGVLTIDWSKCQPGGDLSNCALAQWLSNPQAVKPGNDMQVSLTPDQIKALVAYLESLK
jgi:cytochrome c oxidase subunit 2